jgi:hypothetical protein
MKSVTLTKAAFDVFIHQIKQLTKERDEARRMYCFVTAKDIYHIPTNANCIHVANSKNWDCFKKVKYL